MFSGSRISQISQQLGKRGNKKSVGGGIEILHSTVPSLNASFLQNVMENVTGAG